MSLDELAQSSGARSESERADLLDEIAGLWLGLSQRDIARKFDLKAGVISGIVMRARRRGDERFPSRLNPAPKVRPARIRKLKQIAAAPVPSLGRIGAPVQFLLAVPGMCKFPLNSPRVRFGRVNHALLRGRALFIAALAPRRPLLLEAAASRSCRAPVAVKVR